MVAAQKGPTDFVENYAKYPPTAMLSKAVYADTEGFVSAMDTSCAGDGGRFHGRRSSSGLPDTIDYSVGFSDMARLGDSVDGQRPLAVIHASTQKPAGRKRRKRSKRQLALTIKRQKLHRKSIVV